MIWFQTRLCEPTHILMDLAIVCGVWFSDANAFSVEPLLVLLVVSQATSLSEHCRHNVQIIHWFFYKLWWVGFQWTWHAMLQKRMECSFQNIWRFLSTSTWSIRVLTLASYVCISPGMQIALNRYVSALSCFNKEAACVQGTHEFVCTWVEEQIQIAMIHSGTWTNKRILWRKFQKWEWQCFCSCYPVHI